MALHMGTLFVFHAYSRIDDRQPSRVAVQGPFSIVLQHTGPGGGLGNDEHLQTLQPIYLPDRSTVLLNISKQLESRYRMVWSPLFQEIYAQAVLYNMDNALEYPRARFRMLAVRNTPRKFCS